MASPKQPPVLILVPGHWHSITHLEPLLSALPALNPPLPTQPLQLHTVGRKTTPGPPPKYSDDVSVIYAAVTKQILDGKDVCLVLHSYAGMPGAEAINRLVKDGLVAGTDEELFKDKQTMGKLIRVVFIAAYVFPPKVAFDPKDMVGASNPGFSIDDKGMTHMSSPWHHFYNDLPLSAAKPFVDALAETYYVGPMSLSSSLWRSAPMTALLCRKDNAIPPDRQWSMWSWLNGKEEMEEEVYNEDVEPEYRSPRTEAEVRWGQKSEGERRQGVEWIDACHTPWVSKADEVARVLARVVGHEVGRG